MYGIVVVQFEWKIVTIFFIIFIEDGGIIGIGEWFFGASGTQERCKGEK